MGGQILSGVLYYIKINRKNEVFMASDVTKMTRLVKIVSLLRQNVYPNHKTVEKALRSLDVAGVYNVSQKTIQRDVQYLRDMYAAPIAFDNGRRGYYLTDPEWKFEVPNLEADEMRAVTLGARLAETIMPEPVASEIQSAADALLCENPTGLDANASLIALVAKGARIPVKPEIFQEVFPHIKLCPTPVVGIENDFGIGDRLSDGIADTGEICRIIVSRPVTCRRTHIRNTVDNRLIPRFT